MKHYSWIVLFLLVGCSKPYGSQNDIDALKEVLKGSGDAWNNGDIRGYMAYYQQDSSTQFITKRGRISGWQNTLNMYLKSYPNRETMGHLEFTLDTVRILSSAERMGQITGRWKLYRKADTPQGFFSLITRETEGKPRIIIDHTW